MEKNKNSLDISLNGIKFPLLSEKAILLSKENNVKQSIIPNEKIIMSLWWSRSGS